MFNGLFQFDQIAGGLVSVSHPPCYLVRGRGRGCVEGNNGSIQFDHKIKTKQKYHKSANKYLTLHYLAGPFLLIKGKGYIKTRIHDTVFLLPGKG